MYLAKWFENEKEAKEFQKALGKGVLYKNTPRSRTKKDHILTAQMMGFDPETYRYSVNWNGDIEELKKA